MRRVPFVVGARLALAALCGAACSSLNSPVARHSSNMALTTDGTHLYVANPDSDSVAVINLTTAQLEQEILLNGTRPTADSGGHYAPAVQPRAVAISPHAKKLYVSGQRATEVFVVNMTTNTIETTIPVGSEPIGLLVSPDETSVYVACSQDDEVERIDTATNKVAATVSTARKPWGLAWSANGDSVYVTQLLGSGLTTAGTGVTALNPTSLKIQSTWTIPDSPPRAASPELAYGQGRGLYDVVARPGSSEVWVSHIMLANLTPQPTLAFNTTAFPALSIFETNGTYETTLSTDAEDIAGINGAFGDIVSGPHAFEFTSDGRYALVVDTNSEDVLAVDAVNRVEATLLRPLPGHMPDGIVLSSDGTHAYVSERNTGDVAIVDVSLSSGDASLTPVTLTVEPNVIPTIQTDPMPVEMREGQHLFYSANSDELPITQNHWVACATCHIESHSDAVRWEFIPGPRDTPSNAGGTKDIGFLLHTADRQAVQDYWRVINIEQGGDFSPDVPSQMAELNALETYVDYGIPVPIPPHTNAAMVQAGQAIFERADVGCTGCHMGEARTDSGVGNPTLNLQGPLNLHPVGTCNTGPYPDAPHTDDNGDPRAACQFKTLPLRGLWDSAPYFHDGSAPTLLDALEMTRGTMGNINVLTQDQINDLVEYLKSL